MIKVGIVGGTGYTGIELLRLLCTHPNAEIKAITSRSEVGRSLSDLVPNFFNLSNLVFQEPTLEVLKQCDLVFFATPNGTAMKMTPALLDAGIRVIDLAADFRIKDIATWEQWYGQPHACPDLVAEAVYGLPEINRQAIRQARLVANPGCYPTSVILGFLPLLEHQLVDSARLIADTKSGVSERVYSLFIQGSQDLGPQNKAKVAKNYLILLMIAGPSGKIFLCSAIFDSNLLCDT